MAGNLVFNQVAEPNTPSTDKAVMYVDSADQKTKVKNDKGAISIINHDGSDERNVITNGGFNIQQRQVPASTAIGGISTTTRGGAVADCWSVTTSTASNLAWAQIDTNATVETNLIARYYGSIIKSSAVKKVMISQYILFSEMAHLRGKKVRVSCKTNIKVGNAQTLKLGLIQLQTGGTVDAPPAFLSGAWSATTGTDPAWNANTAAITPDASTPENGTVVGNFLEIAAQQTTWLRSSCVFTVPSNCKGLYVVLFSNETGGATDNISVAEFQLTNGMDIVEYLEPPHADTLVKCLRRYQKSFPLAIAPAASVAVATGGFGSAFILGKAGNATALGSQIPIVFMIRMWKVPTLTLYTPVGAGAVVYRHNGTTPAVQGSTAVLASSLTDIGAIVTATNEATTNGAVGDLVSIHWVAEAEVLV